MTAPVKLHYVEQGQGNPVILLHGFPFDHTIWQAQVDALSDHCRLILPDLRGHGQSPAPDGIYTMDELAGDVIALMDDLHIQRAVWIGHSMGGYILMAALRLAPERISGIGLVATQASADSEERRAGRLAAAEKALQEGGAPVAQMMIKALFAPGFDLISPPAQRIADLISRTAWTGLAGSQRGMAARPDSIETLRGVRVPAVVIAGANDSIIPLDGAQQMAQAIPGARLVEIADAGHLLMLEQPEAVSAALRSFTERL
ncbi:MAG: alpha/beta fold hydrolase [Chloroflexi bacterium]|nr:alpha/beta fold hydrolase [Chloroflexota bacterium]